MNINTDHHDHHPIPICGIDPIDSPALAMALGTALSSATSAHDLLALPLDHRFIGFGVFLFEDGSRHLDSTCQLLTAGLTAVETPQLILYTYRDHDVLSDRDFDDLTLTTMWMANYDIRLVDWFVVTPRRISSMSQEFGFPTDWPN